MGSPIAPSRPQYEALEAASQLKLLEEPRKLSPEDGSLALTFTLPRQAVSLIVVDWIHVKK
jgi:xylan 1,4-beta-xylosidase